MSGIRDESTPAFGSEPFPLREADSVRFLREKLDALGPRAAASQQVIERAYVAARRGKIDDCRSILAAHIGVDRTAELIRLADWGGP